MFRLFIQGASNLLEIIYPFKSYKVCIQKCNVCAVALISLNLGIMGWIFAQTQSDSDICSIYAVTHICDPEVVPGLKLSWDCTENKVDWTRRGRSEANAGVVVNEHVKIRPLNIARNKGGGNIKRFDNGKGCVQPINTAGIIFRAGDVHILEVAKPFHILTTISLAPLQGCGKVVRIQSK